MNESTASGIVDILLTVILLDLVGKGSSVEAWSGGKQRSLGHECMSTIQLLEAERKERSFKNYVWWG